MWDIKPLGHISLRWSYAANYKYLSKDKGGNGFYFSIKILVSSN